MGEEGIIDVNLEKLKEQINELREILNEIYTISEGVELTKDILILSQCLDELIVKYMNQISIKCQARDK
jgi:hypothetical protein